MPPFGHRRDALGEEWELNYLVRRGGREIDFVLSRDREPQVMVEVKWSDPKPSRNFALFAKDLPGLRQVQLLGSLDAERTYPSGVEVRRAAPCLGWRGGDRPRARDRSLCCVVRFHGGTPTGVVRFLRDDCTSVARRSPTDETVKEETEMLSESHTGHVLRILASSGARWRSRRRYPPPRNVCGRGTPDELMAQERVAVALE